MERADKLEKYITIKYVKSMYVQSQIDYSL